MPGHKGTYFRSVYYSSDWAEWWTMQDLLQHMYVDLYPTSGPVDEQLQHVAWNCGLFSALITSILRQLVMEAHFRRADGATDPVFAPGEMLVFVGFA